ncbi:MAG: polymer-forming cytoskeletal protein [Trueperaceae bacterium]|nr:polymer-forming cytoskeletal protein [Trueperaceae bacterium]
MIHPRYVRVFLTLSLASLCLVATASLEPLLLGGRHELAAAETHDGTVTVIAGDLTIAAGARLDGALTLIGGRLALLGTVDGTVHAYGATVELRDGSRIGGSLELTASELVRDGGSVVTGAVHRDADWRVDIDVPRDWERALPRGRTLPWTVPTAAVGTDLQAFWIVLQAGLMALLAFVLARLAPFRLDRIGDAVVGDPVRAGLSGLLAAVVTALAAALLAVTLIGIPVAMLVALAAWLATLLGLAAMADRLGQRTWPEGRDRGARAALGGFLLGLGWAALAFVPILGGPVRSVAGLVALGAVVRTRVGEGSRRPATSPER